jgi:hypothetical protein
VRPPLPELSARELLAESRKALDAATGSLTSLADHVEAPRQLVEPMRRQLELVQELIARERSLQQRAASQLLAPIDAVFDLLEASGESLRKQAQALSAAGEALQESGRLVEAQARLFERTIGTLREPSDLARTAVGLGARTRRERVAKPRRAARNDPSESTRPTTG